MTDDLRIGPPALATETGGIFSHAALQAQIDAELAKVEVPPGRRGVLVGYYTIRGTWRVSVVHRVGEHWSLGATLGKDASNGQIDGGVRVLGSW